MRAAHTLPLVFAAAVLTLTPRPAAADARGVGLGVAAGVNIHRGEGIKGSVDTDTDQSVAWGFFVDIPLLDTFFITPSATVYDLDFGNGMRTVTDIDLNFKFIVPLGRMRAGAGVTAGLTTGLGKYSGHYGLLGYFSFNLVSNLDAFALVQYKRLPARNTEFDNLHGYLGGMFTF